MSDPSAPPTGLVTGEVLQTPPPPPFPPPRVSLTEMAVRVKDMHDRAMAERAAAEAKDAERVALINERAAAAYERMMPGNVKIAADQRAIAEAQLKMWQEQSSFRDQQNKAYLAAMATEQARINNTFDTMFRQTRGAGHMLWITFLLGVALVVTSVGAFLMHPQGANPLIGAFFGAGALSMLAFFLRDPAEKMQRAGGKLVQLQVAMRYNLLETQYWGVYFNSKLAVGGEVRAEELSDALSSMRDGMQVIMRQIDESMDDRGTRSSLTGRLKSRSRRAREDAPAPAKPEA